MFFKCEVISSRMKKAPSLSTTEFAPMETSPEATTHTPPTSFTTLSTTMMGLVTEVMEDLSRTKWEEQDAQISQPSRVRKIIF